MIRRMKAVSKEEENLQIIPIPGVPNAVTIKVDSIEPLPVGSLIIFMFRITGYDKDCDGSLLARLEKINYKGETTGLELNHVGLYEDCTWVVDFPNDLDIADGCPDIIEGSSK